MSEPAPEAQGEKSEWLGGLPSRVGEVLINRSPTGEFLLCHRDDALRADLTTHDSAEAAIDIARYDDSGKYRPLKTAPNLRHGWQLKLGHIGDVRIAVDFFYPGRGAAYVAWTRDKLVTAPFRETLARQSGMYRAAAKISEQEANELIANFCRSDVGCLRTILWKRSADGTQPSTLLPSEKFDVRQDQTGRGERTFPLICQEACNLLVAAAREVVKDAA
ncbi:MAG: hypothetical protein H0U43_04985 [Chthoniobacterales bacterium]|nr:hypothetical protein [Chthoniobacterales bacterium]